jgi:hypothetical protein
MCHRLLNLQSIAIIRRLASSDNVQGNRRGWRITYAPMPAGPDAVGLVVRRRMSQMAGLFRLEGECDPLPEPGKIQPS